MSKRVCAPAPLREDLSEMLRDFVQERLPDGWRVQDEITIDAVECRVVIVGPNAAELWFIIGSVPLHRSRNPDAFLNRTFEMFLKRHGLNQREPGPRTPIAEQRDGVTVKSQLRTLEEHYFAAFKAALPEGYGIMDDSLFRMDDGCVAFLMVGPGDRKCAAKVNTVRLDTVADINQVATQVAGEMVAKYSQLKDQK